MLTFHLVLTFLHLQARRAAAAEARKGDMDIDGETSESSSTAPEEETSVLEELFTAVMMAQDADGRVLHTVFQLLPSKKVPLKNQSKLLIYCSRYSCSVLMLCFLLKIKHKNCEKWWQIREPKSMYCSPIINSPNAFILMYCNIMFNTYLLGSFIQN